MDSLLQGRAHAYEGQQGSVAGALAVGGRHRVAAAHVPREMVISSRPSGLLPGRRSPLTPTMRSMASSMGWQVLGVTEGRATKQDLFYKMLLFPVCLQGIQAAQLGCG